MPELTLHTLSKEYPPRRVLRKVRGTLGSGVYVLLGPNGAGKSTLLHILSTQMTPTGGHFVLESLDSRKELLEIRRRVGMVGHRSLLYPALSLSENLSFYAQLYGVTQPQQVIEQLAAQFQMTDALERVVRTFSRGMVQRAAFMRALLHDPPCLFLDEPFTGLDPRGVDVVLALLETWREEGRMVLLTTHDLNLAARCASHLLLLSKGRLITEFKGPFSVEEIAALYQEHFPSPILQATSTRARKDSSSSPSS